MIPNKIPESANSVPMKLCRKFLIALLILYTGFEFGLFPFPGGNVAAPCIIAHRGVCKNVPENTLPAFDLAIQNGADAIEFDLRRTRDGVLIAFHDRTLKRLTGKHCQVREAQISDLTYRHLCQVPLGIATSPAYRTSSVCTPEEIFSHYKGRTRFHLDLKIAGIETQLISLIQTYGLEEVCELTSKDARVLKRIKQTDPRLTTFLLISSPHSLLSLIKSSLSGKIPAEIDGYSIKSCYVTSSLVRRLHRHGKTVYVWTVNSASEVQRMYNLGVDGIITDVPASSMPGKKPS